MQINVMIKMRLLHIANETQNSEMKFKEIIKEEIPGDVNNQTPSLIKTIIKC